MRSSSTGEQSVSSGRSAAHLQDIHQEHAITPHVAVQTRPRDRMKIAFAITITKDGSVIDGACVLAYSIIKEHENLDIDINFIAFVHPTARLSGEILTRLGYQLRFYIEAMKYQILVYVAI